ncbi:MAG: hypothetical protein A2001_20130 [Treponema sp. GWC1_61_84]|nr:MAG: hypothetical protein A2001_20130 [Treponema sp. GWC1_61_84]
MNSSTGTFPYFDTRTLAWFRSEVGEPTDVQERTWRAVADHQDVLVTAPTGSGKTLAAFLVSLDALARGELAADRLSVLYVSPLKALNTDIRRNLLLPLAGLRAAWAESGSAFPPVTVATRSGDTDAAERRAFLKRPPSILSTTPESLALLLNSPRARENLASVRYLVIDEIHALASSKRGVFLMAQVERLRLLSGGFRRIVLSATVADPADCARFAAGQEETPGGEFVARPMRIVRSELEKRRSVTVVYPTLSSGPAVDAGAIQADSPSRWPLLADSFVRAVGRNRTTLIFTNSRRHAEKIAFLMNERAERMVAWAHHGSLSREVRSAVEERLKAGELPAVVATSSLELGIDIGSIDEVLLVGTPPGAAATLQRTGRAGHKLGAESRALMYPTHGFDLLLAAATSRDAQEGRLERERRPHACLDVLAQLILSLTALDAWDADSLFRFLKTIEPYATLTRTDFDLVVAMLRGRYENSRLPSLAPRLEREEFAGGRLKAKAGVLPLLYRGGGVIPDRGSYVLKLAGSGAPLGELDEEFVWERRLGDSFALGSRSWRIIGIDDRAVTVVPGARSINIVPFWRAENQWRSAEAMDSVLELLDSLPSGEGIEANAAFLRLGWRLDAEAAEALARFLALQAAAAGLPGKRRVVLEAFKGPNGTGSYAFLHTLRGGKTNAALGIALRAAADARFGAGTIEFFWDDAGVLASFPAMEEDGNPLSASGPGPEAFAGLLAELGGSGLSGRLRAGLESTGLFGAAFREAAGRSLLLPKAPFGKRTPLWITRLRSRQLYDAVRSSSDFPLIKEAWRSCIEDILEVESAEALVAGLRSGNIQLVTKESAAPSPFARGSVWISGDSFMYRRDDASEPSALSDELLAELFSRDAEAPRAEAAVVAFLVRRSTRVDPDYRPRGASELADWLDERRVLAAADWDSLAAAVATAVAESAASADASAGDDVAATAGADADPDAVGRIVVRRLILDGASEGLVLSPDVDASSPAFDPAALVAAWLRYEGPVGEERLEALFGSAGPETAAAILDDGALVRLSVGDGPPLVCDAEFASRILRAARAGRRASAGAERRLESLQSLVAARQGIVGTEGPDVDAERGTELLRAALEPLLGAGAPVEAWEREILPARCPYRPWHLELLMRRSPLSWRGAGEGRSAFVLDGEAALADGSGTASPSGEPELSSGARTILELLRAGPKTIAEAARGSGLSEGEAGTSLRELARGGYAHTDRFTDAADFLIPRRRPQATARPVLRSRWQRAKGTSSLWTAFDEAEGDAVDESALLREKARRLLSRFGVLSRSVAVLAAGGPAWNELFRALRLMEFSGEVVGGRFFEGLDELQFMGAADAAGAAPDDGAVSGAAAYCLNACDPASLCSFAPLSRRLDLPARLPSNYVVWRGGTPLLVARRGGRELDFRVPPESPDAVLAVTLLARRLCGRAVDPLSILMVETVGGSPVRTSAWEGVLRAAGFSEGTRGMEYVFSG